MAKKWGKWYNAPAGREQVTEMDSALLDPRAARRLADELDDVLDELARAGIETPLAFFIEMMYEVASEQSLAVWRPTGTERAGRTRSHFAATQALAGLLAGERGISRTAPEPVRATIRVIREDLL